MGHLTNKHDISLAMAVWLLHDEYDNGAGLFPDKDLISATSLIKPLKQFIMSRRVPYQEQVNDLSDFIASRLGHAIHDSVEKAWLLGYQKALKKLGWSDEDIERIRINPPQEYPDTKSNAIIPVYLEQRFFRVFSEHLVISGQADLIIEGQLNDMKSTSTFSYTKGSKNKDYQLQGSIYRWLRPDLITKDTIRIQFIFTDWQRFKAKIDPNYPQQRVLEEEIPLMSLSETEAWINHKIGLLYKYQDVPEESLPRCSDEDLWRSDPVYKYYSDPQKAREGGRATRVFSSFGEAMNFRSNKGKGEVVTIPGQVKACIYCPAFDICQQRKEYEFEQ